MSEANPSPNRLSYLQQWDAVLETFRQGEHNPSHDSDTHLLNEHEHAILRAWNLLSEGSKLVFIRLMMRKHKIERVVRLAFRGDSDSYSMVSMDDEAEEMEPHVEPSFLKLLDELQGAGLIQLNSTKDTSVLLPLLCRPELLDLAKLYKVPKTAQRTVPSLVEALKRTVTELSTAVLGFQVVQKKIRDEHEPMETTTISVPKQRALNSAVSLFEERVLKAVGTTIWIPLEIRDLFKTLFLVYNRDREWVDDPFLVHILSNLRVRRLHHVPYKINRCSLTWPTREDLVAYINVCKLQKSVSDLLDSIRGSTPDNVREQIYNKVISAGESCVPIFTQWMQDFQEEGHVTGIPWLSCFTAGMKASQVLATLGTCYQRTHQLEKACDIYALLLSHKILGMKRGRGKLWDEYMKVLMKRGETTKAYTVGIEALQDSALELGSRHSVETRMRRLQKKFGRLGPSRDTAVEEPLLMMETSMTMQSMKSCFHRVVVAEKTFSVANRKALYRCPITDEECEVEQVALNEFSRLGFKGAHVENSIVTTLFGMLFWDILFDDSVPGVFASPFQDAPLDLGTEFFYAARKEKIDRRLRNLEAETVEEFDWPYPHRIPVDSEEDPEIQSPPLHVRILSYIDLNHRETATRCRGVHWSLFSRGDLLDIGACLQGRQVAVICRSFMESYGSHRGGAPDLCVWNVKDRDLRLVEVKGQGDRLSHSQIMWLHLLKGVGVTVEVFDVQNAGGKRPRQK